VLDRDCDPTPDSRASVIAFRRSLLGTPEAIRLGLVGVEAAAAVALAVGLLHDVDKLLVRSWHTVSAEDVRDVFGGYRIGYFLERFGVRISWEQFATLIAYVETRSADRLPNV
jgi:hypothetical protein